MPEDDRSAADDVAYALLVPGTQKLRDAVAEVARSIDALRATLHGVRDDLTSRHGPDASAARSKVAEMDAEIDRLKSAVENLRTFLVVEPELYDVEPLR